MEEHSSFYRTIASLEEQGKEFAICTIVESSGSVPRHIGSRMLVFPDGQFDGSVGGGEVESRVLSEAQEALSEGKPRLLRYRMVDPQRGDPGICGGQLEVYIEPVMPKVTLVVLGAGHVGKAVAHLAKWMGFRVVVSDDRPEFCTPEFIPDADAYYPVPMAELPKQININRSTYLVLTTRGSGVDIEGLPALLETNAKYIGIIGSKRRWIHTRKNLLEAGIEESQLSRVHSPIGIEVQAETPEEIAVSIMAEVLMVRHGGTGESMKY